MVKSYYYQKGITEGKLFKFGFNKDLDDIQRFHSEADQVLSELEEHEKQKTGLKNLKIKLTTRKRTVCVLSRVYPIRLADSLEVK